MLLSCLGFRSISPKTSYSYFSQGLWGNNLVWSALSTAHEPLCLALFTTHHISVFLSAFRSMFTSTVSDMMQIVVSALIPVVHILYLVSHVLTTSLSTLCSMENALPTLILCAQYPFQEPHETYAPLCWSSGTHYTPHTLSLTHL